MSLVKLYCTSCRKALVRTDARVNEAKKFGWNAYCSFLCEGNALKKRTTFRCGRSGCDVTFYRTPHEIKSAALYCSRRCAAIVNNTKTPKRKAFIGRCAHCNRNFKGDQTYCSVVCKTKDQIISGEKICQKIKDFYDAHGRIPVKREFLHYNAARDRFSTWSNAIKAAGFKPNPVLFAEKQIANDGHHCDSIAEKIIDDWLTSKGIEHKRSVPYPEDGRLTADFVFGNHWIEFFGLAGEMKDYDRLIRKKRRICEKHNIPLTEIYPKDIGN